MNSIRPRGITALGIFYITYPPLMVLLYFFGYAFFLNEFYLALIPPQICAAIGLLIGKKWAWKLTIILLLIEIGLDILMLYVDHSFPFFIVPIQGIIIHMIILFYLFKPQVKAYFGITVSGSQNFKNLNQIRLLKSSNMVIIIIATVSISTLVIFLYSHYANHVQFGNCDPNNPLNRTGEIPWTKDHLLSFADYEGVPNYNSSSTLCTRTYTDFGHYIKFDYDTNSSEFHVTNFTVTAYFAPYSSWVKPTVFQDHAIQNLLLKHEQGRFDFAEIYAKKIQNNLASKILEKKFSLNSTDTKTQQDEVIKIILPIIQNEFNKTRSELDVEVRQYDYKTNYGLNETAQASYDIIFDELLSSNTKR